MRRPSRLASITLASLALLASGVLAACGSSGSSGDTLPTVTGSFGARPTVSVPKHDPPAQSKVSVVSRGSGAEVKKGDLVVVNDYSRTWDDDKPFDDTFGDQPPLAVSQGMGMVMPGLDSAFIGVPLGSRVLLVLPPDQAFGSQGQPQLGIKGTDTIVMVVDLIDDYAADAGPTGDEVSKGGGALPTVTATPGKAPAIAIPPNSTPPKDLSVTTLVQGTGPELKKGQLLVAQYVGVNWRTGKTFDSSWEHGVPASFQVGVGALIDGWDEGLVGRKIGSRVLLVVPPDKGYGPSGGQSDAGIEKDDTLVFTVTLLGAY